jgi:nucleotide-binding universal stress UspA family protein
MYKRIVVPLDGSKGAERALPLAARLARCTAGTLLLMRAVPAPGADGPHLASSLVSPAARLAEDAAAYLNDLAAHLGRHGIATEQVIQIGAAGEAIVAAARAHDADSILLRSTGRTSRTRWMLGSVARQVVRDAPVPVLVAREGGRPLPPANRYDELPRGSLRMLVPLDGSPLAEAALIPALRLAEALAIPEQGNLHLAHILPAFSGSAEAGAADAARYLDELTVRLEAERTARPGPSITWSVLFDTDVPLALANLAERGEEPGAPAAQSFDLIALATHGQGGLERKLLGGVAEQLLNHTRLPVLVVRPRSRATLDAPIGAGASTTNESDNGRDRVLLASLESFPASDAPSWLPHRL